MNGASISVISFIHGERKMESASARVKARRKLCPHCGEFVTKSTFYRHKSKFFNKHTKIWVSAGCPERCSSDSSGSDEPQSNNISEGKTDCSFSDVEISTSLQAAGGFTSGKPFHIVLIQCSE